MAPRNSPEWSKEREQREFYRKQRERCEREEHEQREFYCQERERREREQRERKERTRRDTEAFMREHREYMRQSWERSRNLPDPDRRTSF